MKKYKLYHPAGKETVNVQVLFEKSYDFGAESITAQEILNSNYAGYSPCTVSIPAELHPEVYESVYDQRFLRVDGVPVECRYRVRYHSGRPYMEVMAPTDDEYTQPPTLYRFRVHLPR
jgi:hypothetical protein